MKKTWRWLRSPSQKRSAGFLLLAGAVGGLIAWGSFNSFLHYSNSYAFCTSCHEMSWVDEEYRESPHFSNTSGVRAICSDCHVPKDWVPKMQRKIRATFKELPGKIMGTINTREKFEAKRLELAEHVWAEMKANDSRECRNCHDRDAMALVDQRRRAQVQHEEAKETGDTCIDCHTGIAHTEPEVPQAPGGEEAQEEGGFQL